MNLNNMKVFLIHLKLLVFIAQNASVRVARETEICFKVRSHEVPKAISNILTRELKPRRDIHCQVMAW
jgi:hypothetical protein